MGEKLKLAKVRVQRSQRLSACCVLGLCYMQEGQSTVLLHDVYQGVLIVGKVDQLQPAGTQPKAKISDSMCYASGGSAGQ
jgi:hypothetical protein